MARMSAPPDGTVIVGKYRVERALGSGGMGVVVEATHLALDQRVALKLLDAELAASPEILARFLREARIAARLPSEHVTRVTDVGQTESGLPYIVMELLTGHDLEAEIKHRRQLPTTDAVDWIIEACAGVADAHAAGLVHRDLKPANLFLARRQNRPPIVKVLDFGLSKEAPAGHAMSLTGGEAVFGTPQYMSPEQIQSTKNVDARSDQHAIAMILFEMLTGRTPYSAENVTQLIVTIATKPPLRVRELRPDVPLELEAAIARALEKRADDRFSNLASFAEAIAPFGSPVARETVKLVRAAFGPGRSLRPPPPGPPAPVAASDANVTAPMGLAAQTHTSLTSSVDPIRRAARKSRTAVVIAASVATALVGAAIVAVLLLRPGAKEVPEAASAAASDARAASVSAAPTASEAATVTPGASVDPAGSATAAPSASAPPAPGTSDPGAKKGRLSNKPLPPKPAVSSAIGVFGDRKK